jgi:hypothetical protein
VVKFFLYIKRKMDSILNAPVPEARRIVAISFLTVFAFSLLVMYPLLLVHQFAPFQQFSIEDFIKFHIDVTVMVVPYLLFVLLMIDYKLPVVSWKVLLACNTAVFLFLIPHGWSIWSAVAWSLLFWLVFIFSKDRMSYSHGLYLAALCVLLASSVWEFSVLYAQGNFTALANLFGEIEFPGIISSKLLCVPFIGVILKDYKWKMVQNSFLAISTYAFWQLAWAADPPALVGWLTYIIRLPTVAFFFVFVFAGLGMNAEFRVGDLGR